MRWLGWIDDYFAEKSLFEKFALFVLLGLLLGYFLHLFFIDDAKRVHFKAKGEQSKIENRILTSEKYMQNMTDGGDAESKLNSLDEDIAKMKEKKSFYDSKLAKIDKNLQELSGLLFNKENWSEFLNSITIKAKQNNIIIDTINNKYVDNNGSFGHVLEIGVKCKGGFDNIMNFMNDMEQNTLVTDIYRSDIRPDGDSSSELVADINISVWGVNH